MCEKGDTTAGGGERATAAAGPRPRVPPSSEPAGPRGRCASGLPSPCSPSAAVRHGGQPAAPRAAGLRDLSWQRGGKARQPPQGPPAASPRPAVLTWTLWPRTSCCSSKLLAGKLTSAPSICPCAAASLYKSIWARSLGKGLAPARPPRLLPAGSRADIGPAGEGGRQVDEAAASQPCARRLLCTCRARQQPQGRPIRVAVQLL